ncbi:MAG: phage portal protein [Methylocystis sp.]|uniref:phage portal protein n=1 Tax=Methylocystis sp. TaxID=1911079 RepID=UPI003DA60F92
MLNWFRKRLGRDTYNDEEPIEQAPEVDALTQGAGVFSTHFLRKIGDRNDLIQSVIDRNIQVDSFVDSESGMALDDAKTTGRLRSFSMANLTITDNQFAFFGSQGFIGYQTMAILAQNWLIARCLSIPARDAIRNGYEIAVVDGTELTPEILEYMQRMDKAMNLTKNLHDAIYYKRMYGIRIVKFDVDSPDPEYYEKPFNIDGVRPGAYRGITQIDPYWITPELNGDAASNPDSRHFYEPTWWRVNGQRIHRTHLVILRGPEVADILKPTYLYGGLSVTQQIFERVYAAERTANEAPMLAQTKRETVIHVDVEKAVANQAAFEEKMAVWANFRSNYGIKVAGKEETIEQFETSLADLDATIMTQYQLVAAAAGVPVTKLMGTVPKGFNSTGEYDEASYHEELESAQTHDLTRIVERHYMLMNRSYVLPKFGKKFDASPSWKPLDALTAKELAEVNKIKAETGVALMQAGAIDSVDERTRITNDPDSGYTGLAEPAPELPPDDEAL